MDCYIYAQLNENRVCMAVSMLSGPVEAEHMILIGEFDESLMGKKYVNGTWQKEDD